jgi:hypothetical protein
MMKFSVSFCDPIEPDSIAWGDMAPDTIMDHFEKIDWNVYLQKSMAAKLDDIYFDPSFEVEHKETKRGLCISAVGSPDKYVFRITYKRPRKVKSFFGLFKKHTKNYSSAIQGQTKAEAKACLNAFLSNDTGYLAEKIGQ